MSEYGRRIEVEFPSPVVCWRSVFTLGVSFRRPSFADRPSLFATLGIITRISLREWKKNGRG